jgi:hypothetical protein
MKNASSLRQQETLAVAEQRAARQIEVEVERASQAMAIRRRLDQMSLSKQFDDLFVKHASILGGSALTSEVREAALAELIYGNQPVKPEHWKQDTPPEQAVAIIASIEGWLSNLEDGTSEPERVIEKVRRNLEDLRILCSAKRGQPSGWLRKTW